MTYKQKAVEKAKALLKSQDLLDCIVRGEFDDFLDRIRRVAQSGKNLLYLASPKSSDLSILFHEGLDRQAFCQAFVDLIHGPEPSPERLAKYVAWVEESHLPNKWTFPTYFLFVCHPESDIFVKPQTIGWFLKASGLADGLPSAPSPELYAHLLDLCQQLKHELGDYQPQDYVDIQGFIWTAYRASLPSKKLAHPFSKMFQDWDQAQWAFDLLQSALECLGVQTPDHPLLTVTLRSYSSEFRLRVNYGKWLVLGINGKAGSISSIHVTLYKDRLKLPSLYEGDFTQQQGEPQITIYKFEYNVFKANETEIMDLFASTTAFLVQRFSGWQSSPHHTHHKKQLANAILLQDERDKVLSSGIQAEAEGEGAVIEAVKRYWKIAPGENAWNWEACKQGGFITIGWEETGDVSTMQPESFAARCKVLLEEHPEWGPRGIEQVWTFAHIQEGDRVIANRGTREAIGIGTVTGPYYYVPGIEHGHHLPVRWDDIQLRPISKGHWVRTLIEMDQKEFDEILNIHPVSELPIQEPYFTEQTFTLLDGLHADPTQKFYGDHKQDFKQHVEHPFQNLMKQVAEQLSPEVLERIETGRNVFSQFHKNDYGKGGAWDFYWGAFYPKGGKRTADPQLFMTINCEGIEVGFSLSDYAELARGRLMKNCSRNSEKLLEWLNEITQDPEIVPGRPQRSIPSDGALDGPAKRAAFQKWFEHPETFEYRIAVVWTKDQVIQMSQEQMVERVAELYHRFFPFMLLAISEDPMDEIAEYLEIQIPTELQPVYSLTQCAEETGIELVELERWMRAIERKKQVIIYGPPGTGKTFLAKKLSKHLIGGGDGFDQLVQFHPEVSYEDFIQGIRAKKHPEGGLDFPVLPGRFMEFCAKASGKKGTCVLIIDEINRANLARVFGELMYLLEYRAEEVELATGSRFKIPANVRILGTMNTADRSIALVDHALRRRFAFLSLYPDYSILQKYHEREHTGFPVMPLVTVLEQLNQAIGDRHYTVGPSFFLCPDLASQIADIWRMEIEPYLEEYFFDQPGKYQEFCWEVVSARIFG